MKKKKKKIVKKILKAFFMFMRLVAIIVLPYLLAQSTLFYFRPEIGQIYFTYSSKSICEESGKNCKNQLSKEFPLLQEERLNALSKEIDQKLIDLKFLETLSKFPLSDFIFYDFELKNDSHIGISISEPQNKITEELNIECNDKPSLLKSSTLKEIIPNFHIIKDFILNNCKPAPYHSNKEFIWGSGAWLTVEISEKYNIDFIPSSKSKKILYIIWLIITLALIPLLKQSIKFIVKGKNYFSE